MLFTSDMIEEIQLLTRYNLDTAQAGLKIHSTAAESVILATKRLYDKGLVTQEDGGYLTGLGRTASEHAQDLLRILQYDA